VGFGQGEGIADLSECENSNITSGRFEAILSRSFSAY